MSVHRPPALFIRALIHYEEGQSDFRVLNVEAVLTPTHVQNRVRCPRSFAKCADANVVCAGVQMHRRAYVERAKGTC
jgi:hypothetical protein